jgi:hypothetical protein
MDAKNLHTGLFERLGRLMMKMRIIRIIHLSAIIEARKVCAFSGLEIENLTGGLWQRHDRIGSSLQCYRDPALPLTGIRISLRRMNQGT